MRCTRTEALKLPWYHLGSQHPRGHCLKKNAVTRCAAILALLVVSTAYVVGSTNSPFLYFNF